MYVEQRQRKELQNNITDLNEYLKALGMVIIIEKANPFNIPRISQLTQKTNQFNMTTKRYLEEDINKYANNYQSICLGVSVEDKFGDNGLVGVVIILRADNTWTLDSFLLSCRVLGRQIEKALLCYVLIEAKKAGAKQVVGEYIPTKKNIQFRNFYKDNCFEQMCVADKNKRELYAYKFNELSGARNITMPDCIKVVVKEAV